jgi:flagellum-specific peptidoglycan hydrolase FlgJ
VQIDEIDSRKAGARSTIIRLPLRRQTMSNNSDFWTVRQPAHVIHFIQIHAASANLVSARTGIPAAVILAQSALESNWGRAVKGNDYFGLQQRLQRKKAASTANLALAVNGVPVATGNVRLYPSYAEAASDYATLLLNEFPTALAYRFNPEEFAEILARQGYSPDPQYASKLCSIILLNVLPMLAFLSGR